MLAVLGATLVGSEESASVSVEDSELLNARIELSVDVGGEVVLILELFAGHDNSFVVARSYCRAKTGRTTFGSIEPSREDRGVAS
jgi:hypothetical protein